MAALALQPTGSGGHLPKWILIEEAAIAAMQFYILEQTLTGAGKSAWTDVTYAPGAIRGDAPRCPCCGNFLGMRRWLARNAFRPLGGD